MNPRPTAIAILLLLLAAFVASDLIPAMSAQACPDGAGCYPWGAEGPAAGSWSYASKSNYVLRGFGQAGLAIMLAGFLLLRARGRPLSAKENIAIAMGIGITIALFFV